MRNAVPFWMLVGVWLKGDTFVVCSSSFSSSSSSNVVDDRVPISSFTPNQFYKNVIDIPLRFVLNRDTTMQMRVNWNETVSLTLYVSSILNTDNLLQGYARQQGSNILL